MPTPRVRFPSASATLVLTGIALGILLLWLQPVQPAGVLALLVLCPFLVLARALYPSRGDA